MAHPRAQDQSNAPHLCPGRRGHDQVGYEKLVLLANIFQTLFLPNKICAKYVSSKFSWFDDYQIVVISTAGHLLTNLHSEEVFTTTISSLNDDYKHGLAIYCNTFPLYSWSAEYRQADLERVQTKSELSECSHLQPG